MEGPTFRVMFSDRAYSWLSECGCRRTHEDFPRWLRKIVWKDQVLLQGGLNSTQSINRIEEEDVEDANPADRDEEGNEIAASRVQDDDSEVSFQEKQAISSKCII